MTRHQHPEDSPADLLRRLVGGDPAAAERVLRSAPTSDSASLVAAAAVLAHDPDLLAHATAVATTARERQLVALVAARLRGDASLFDALVRDHLVEHPDHLLAAWVAGRPTDPRRTR